MLIWTDESNPSEIFGVNFLLLRTKKAFRWQTLNLNLNSTLRLHFQVNTFGANINEQFIENPSKFDPDRFDVGKTTK